MLSQQCERVRHGRATPRSMQLAWVRWASWTRLPLSRLRLHSARPLQAALRLRGNVSCGQSCLHGGLQLEPPQVKIWVSERAALALRRRPKLLYNAHGSAVVSGGDNQQDVAWCARGNAARRTCESLSDSCSCCPKRRRFLDSSSVTRPRLGFTQASSISCSLPRLVHGRGGWISRRGGGGWRWRAGAGADCSRATRAACDARQAQLAHMQATRQEAKGKRQRAWRRTGSHLPSHTAALCPSRSHGLLGHDFLKLLLPEGERLGTAAHLLTAGGQHFGQRWQTADLHYDLCHARARAAAQRASPSARPRRRSCSS